ncbi:pentapeptide repeat-containing protein [Mesorhizobium sp. M0904]|uniref:pentapeptide repeat-containing protein n=1 Tax=unclassified Mesorhizobium TaxID=325217 RepID=UPI00333AE7F3
MTLRRTRAYGTSGLVLAVCTVFAWQNAAAAQNCDAAATPGVNWQECDKKLLILDGQDLSGANLFGVDFTSTDLRNTNLVAANLEKATLVRASLADSTAKGARFDRIEGYRTDFSRMDAQGAVFASAEMQRSNFQDANLTNVDFTKAELGRAQFHDADISGSRFSFANLARADFRGARFTAPIDFDRAFFFLTRIEGLDLSNSVGLSQWQLNMACGDARTELPSGLTRPEDWPCQFQQE